NNKNLLLAVALAAAVLLLWQYFVATPAMKVEEARQAALSHQEKGKPAPQASGAAPAIPGIASPTAHMSRDAALKAGGARVAIDTPMVDGSILLKGADYPYYATFGWIGAQGMPDDNSEWRQTNGGTLSPGHPVTLAWDNGQGLVFTRVIAIDDKYMFTIADSVANRGGAGVSLFPYGTVERQSIPKTVSSWSFHEGFVGVANGSEKDAVYSDFKDPGTPP